MLFYFTSTQFNDECFMSDKLYSYSTWILYVQKKKKEISRFIFQTWKILIIIKI